MSLVINAPGVEGRLKLEAAKRGLSAADFAAEILSEHLGAASPDDTSVPFYATATPEQWTQAFDGWINSHPVRTPLPDAALTREGIYEGRY